MRVVQWQIHSEVQMAALSIKIFPQSMHPLLTTNQRHKISDLTLPNPVWMYSAASRPRSTSAYMQHIFHTMLLPKMQINHNCQQDYNQSKQNHPKKPSDFRLIALTNRALKYF